MTCICDNAKYGFDCSCKHTHDNPGNKVFTCEYCGLYTASEPQCNKCECEYIPVIDR
jgi:hypothetical protein